MAEFDFDEVINRREVPALKHHRIVLGEDGMDLFPAGVADMDFRVAPCITDAIEQRAAHGVFGYETVPDGLMTALTGWLEHRHGWTVDPAQILRAPNVLNALAMAANLFTEAGDGIIVQPPVFFDFADIIAENGRVLVENPLILKTVATRWISKGWSAPRAIRGRACSFCATRTIQWAAFGPRDELAQLGEICRRNDVLVVSDEIHGDITFPGHTYTPFASLSLTHALNSITCLSPAKSFNIAACCSAFTVVPDEDRRKAFQAENSRLTVNKNNAFASVAMQAAYSQGGPWLDAVIRYIAGNLDLVRTRLTEIPEINLIEPDGTFLIWLDFRALGLAPDELTTFLRQKAGWAITRGIAFGPQGTGFGRLNIACPRSRLTSALDQLSARRFGAFMSIVIHHNPDCGTSRNVLAIIRASGTEPVVIDYLRAGWTRPQLLALFAAANLTPRTALRTTKSPAVELGLTEPGVSDETLLDAMIEHPILVNRPIVCSAKGVRLCRPSETVLDLLDQMPPGPLFKEDGAMILNQKGERVD